MAKTSRQSSESMRRRFPKSDIGAPQWVQIVGGASKISAAGDGSFWVLAPDGPNGGLGAADKYIWHNVGGNWTNVGGAAAHIAAAQDGSLWAVNSLGGIYHNVNGTWFGIAGGSKEISVAADGTIYVISSTPGDAGIYHYDLHTWTQLPGAGTSIAASYDRIGHGPFGPGGFWVTNSLGEIYYYSPGVGYQSLNGKAARIAPTKNGGIFVLGFPANTSGNPLYYNDLDSSAWSQIPGGAVDLATDTNYLYAVGGSGGIFKTPLTYTTTVPSSPSPSPFPNASPVASGQVTFTWSGNGGFIGSGSDGNTPIAFGAIGQSVTIVVKQPPYTGYAFGLQIQPQTCTPNLDISGTAPTFTVTVRNAAFRCSLFAIGYSNPQLPNTSTRWYAGISVYGPVNLTGTAQ